MTDPGQQGQPYGGSNPYGQQGGNPYQPPGGEGPAPQQPYGGPQQPYGPPQQPYGGPPVQPVKKGGAGKVIAIVVGVVVVLLAVCGVGIVFVAHKANKTDTTNAKVNDCIKSDALDSTTAKEVSGTKIVPCTSGDAKYKVVGIVNNKTEVDFNVDNDICKAYPDAKSELWQGERGKSGSVLCLAPVSR